MTIIDQDSMRNVSHNDGLNRFIIMLLGTSTNTFPSLAVNGSWRVRHAYIEWEEDGECRVILQTFWVHMQVLLHIEQTSIAYIGAVQKGQSAGCQCCLG